MNCTPSKGEQTRQKIKITALKLFAQRGLEGVSVRDINKAAGQKNAGSINYHFSSRDDLIQEIMLDVGKILDTAHAENIADLEAKGGPNSIREVARLMVEPPCFDAEDPASCSHSLRFLQMAMMSHREMLIEAMKDRDPGLTRCLDHIRRMAPEMPEEVLEQRLKLAMKFLLMTGSVREEAMQHQPKPDPLWSCCWMPDNVADTFAGIICAPVSDETLTGLAQEK